MEKQIQNNESGSFTLSILAAVANEERSNISQKREKMRQLKKEIAETISKLDSLFEDYSDLA